MNRKTLVSLFGAAAVVALMPVSASARDGFSISIGTGGYGYDDSRYGYDPYGGYNRHNRQHDNLEDRHEDGHEDLNEAHDQAHDQGVSRRGHRRLHRDLRDEHEYRDYRLGRQHQDQHQRNRWQSRSRGYDNHYYRY